MTRIEGTRYPTYESWLKVLNRRNRDSQQTSDKDRLEKNLSAKRIIKPEERVKQQTTSEMWYG